MTIGLKTQNSVNLVKLGSTRSTRTEFTSLTKVTVPTLLHTPQPSLSSLSVFCPNLTFSSLNLSTASISNANLGLGFCWGRRQGGWERGRERKRGAPATLIRVWDFSRDVDRAGERGGGRGKGGFERWRISGWWKWKPWEE